MQTGKKRKEGFQANSNLLQSAVGLTSVCDSIKDNNSSSLDYVMSPPTFNLKYKSDVTEYILAMRLKKGLDAVPKQVSVFPTRASLEQDSHFIYCLRIDQIKNVKFDPYTLVMVSPAKAKSFSTYFTASTWSITEVKCQQFVVCFCEASFHLFKKMYS